MSQALSIEHYALLEDAECQERILKARERLKDRCVILGHHYQRDEVFVHADFSGDSLKLSRKAADSGAEFIIFLGVHFMAEVADILSRETQISILPDLAAGCSMADMAGLPAVERAYQEISAYLDPETTITPVTYINSAADLKAFCGRHGGIVCTSSNAERILRWSFERREKILFFPDQHLGRNTGYRMGIPLEEMVTYDFTQPLGGLTPEALMSARMILWKGFCSVHQVFRPEHIDRFLEKHEDTTVIVHPECSFEVCQKADKVGSTEYILETVRKAEPRSRWLVGTELNLVNRLSAEMRARKVDVHFLSPTICMCSTMFRIDPPHLAWVLENLVEGRIVNRIEVPPDIKAAAKTALDRMLALA